MSKRVQNTALRYFFSISRTRRLQLIEDIDKEYQEVSKEPNLISPENLPEYI